MPSVPVAMAGPATDNALMIPACRCFPDLVAAVLRGPTLPPLLCVAANVPKPASTRSSAAGGHPKEEIPQHMACAMVERILGWVTRK